MATVGVVGVGYVGLTQALGMSQLGHSVIAYDQDLEKINGLQRGNSPFFEPGLESALKESIFKKKIFFTNDVKLFAETDFIFLCLPTPEGHLGSADTSYLFKAINDISNFLRPNTFLIIKSTVPLGTATKIKGEIKRDDLPVISNPEFLREGSAFFDFHNPDRIVIGAESIKWSQMVSELYKGISTEFVLTDNDSAELIKYGSNAFLAIKLSYVNDLAGLCDRVGANAQDVLYAIGLDKRIGDKFLTPGPGWGGSCFPKDTQALIYISNQESFSMPLLKAAVQSNRNTQARLVEKIKNIFPRLDEISVAVLGLSFKANTDDTRNSPAIDIVNTLIGLGVNAKCYDPAVDEHNDLNIYKNLLEVFVDANLILVLTEWSEFKLINPFKISKIVKEKKVLDARGILPKDRWKKYGFEFL